MKLFSDIWQLIIALRFVDIVFFFAVLVLMLLIVTLIYFIKINNTEKEEVKLEETAEMKIVRELKENNMNSSGTISFTDYEKDQEDKAIISYDELLNKSNKYELNYENEVMDNDLSIKKVNLESMTNVISDEVPKVEGRVISFAKEEAFLQALKQLQKELG